MNGSSTILAFMSSALLQETGETAASSDLKTALMESYEASMGQMGMEISQAQMESMFPMLIAGMILVFAVLAIGALAIVFVLIHAVANINGRPLKEVLKKKETEEKIRLVDIWLILFVIYTLYQCVIIIGI